LKRAAFLDRDGTLNRRPPPHEYVTTADAFEWLAGAREGAALLAASGHMLAVVSNQRGVARGLVTVETLRSIEGRIQDGLRPLGVQIAAFRYCMHDLDASCACRKPAPGLILELADEFELDLAQSWMIGDSETDVAAGRRAGCRTAIVGDATAPTHADVTGSTLLDVSTTIQALNGPRFQAGSSRSNSATNAL
jgi:D-glycero-D-manno-heptose 1,7-bisphosphate phosphatase